MAWGWRGWWLQPNQDPQHPSAGGNLAWHRPEWREANCGPVCANRVRSGSDAQKYFTFFSVHDAGMYQQVSGITPGTLLRFSVYMQAWSTDTQLWAFKPRPDHGHARGHRSLWRHRRLQPERHLVDAFDTFDAWGLYTVQAAAQAGAVTVFTRSTPLYGNQHNDIYVDDASLVAVGADNSGAAVTSRPTIRPRRPQPAPTDVPAPVPGFTYVVVRGDNYYSIALRFGVSLSLLYQVNHVVNPRLLFVGTVLLIPSSNPPPDNTGGQVNNPPPPAPTATTPPSQLAGRHCLHRAARR